MEQTGSSSRLDAGDRVHGQPSIKLDTSTLWDDPNPIQGCPSLPLAAWGNDKPGKKTEHWQVGWANYFFSTRSDNDAEASSVADLPGIGNNVAWLQTSPGCHPPSSHSGNRQIGRSVMNRTQCISSSGRPLSGHMMREGIEREDETVNVKEDEHGAAHHPLISGFPFKALDITML